MDDSKVEFDIDGFIKDSDLWTWQLAQQLAHQEGLGELTDDHRAVIDYMRKHYLENKTIPVMRHVCKETGLEDHCVSDLLSNPEIAWRIAGLPNPGEEAKAYMDSAEIKS